MKREILPFLLAFLGVFSIQAQPLSLVGDVSVQKLMNTSANPIRIDKDPLTHEMYYLTDRGDIYRIDTANKSETLIFSTSDHGLDQTFGLEIGATGNFYVVAAEISNGYNTGKVARGVPDGSGGYSWNLLARTLPYRVSGNRDHKFNAIIESKDGKYVYVNSGSRTDHAEEAKNDGLREMPITSAILKIPVDTSNMLLRNDETFLNNQGVIFADGIRNTFDMEYAPNGDLFGVENSDTRDNEEELNWLQEGKHYGFPWKIGTHHNPQQFPDFNPPGSDNLLVAGINMESTFYNDPSFPPPPAGVTFTEPILNTGPDADIIRDSVDGNIKDANAIGRPMGTFTPHSSPVALTFDTEYQLGGAYTGHGFAMSYNASRKRKYTPFLDPGEDLMWLQLNKQQGQYTTSVTRIAEGFSGPIDAVLVGNKMYVLEYGGEAIWEITFPTNGNTGIQDLHSSISPLLNLAFEATTATVTLSSAFSPLLIRQSKIYDLNGSLLKTIETQETERLSFSLDGISSGVYFIRVLTNKGLAVKKVVKP